MTDNITLPGTGIPCATDDVGGIHYQRVKLDIGGDGATSPVVAGNGLPVAVVGTVPVSGTVAVTGAYQATQPVSIAAMPSTPVTGAFFQVTQPVSGTVTVGNASLAVTGTFFQATQPVSIAATVAVSGPITDAQIRATALPVSLASTTVTGSVAVTGPLTDTQLRAAVVPVSLTSTTIAGTVAATQSGTWNVTNISGTVSLPTGASTSALQSTGNSSLSSMDGKTPALGQALAASSTPVVLTAAQITTLTPPAAITGFSTEATLAALNTKVTAVNTGAVVLAAGAAAIGTVTAVGNIAQGVADTGNPVEIGGHASLLLPYTVVDGQRVRAWYGNYGNASVSLVAFDGAHMSQNGLINDTSSNSQNRLTTQAFPMVFNGTTWDRQRGTIANGMAVDVTRMSPLVAGAAAIGTVGVTSLPALATGANVIGALTANQSVNNAQIGGVAVATGNGVVGTGVQRVAIASDNSPVPIVDTDATTSGTLGALNATVTLQLNGESNFAMRIDGTFVGTITVLRSVDGVTFDAVNAALVGAGTLNQTFTAPGSFVGYTGANAAIQLKMTAYTSGSATVTLRAGAGSGAVFMVAPVPTGANVIGKVGIDQTTPGTTNLVALAAPSATYSASIVGLATAVTATDIFTITGSATKTVRVTRIVVNGVQTTAAQVNVLLVKRSTANTAGTSTAPTRVPYDSTNAAVTATVLAYTANPTLGTAVGTGSARRAFIPGAATASDAQGLEIVSGDVGQQTMTLRGIAEVLAVNLNSTTVAGAALNITVEWTES